MAKINSKLGNTIIQFESTTSVYQRNTIFLLKNQKYFKYKIVKRKIVSGLHVQTARHVLGGKR